VLGFFSHKKTKKLMINNFETKIITNKTQIQTLEKLRDTLLPKLISGEVRIMKDKY